MVSDAWHYRSQRRMAAYDRLPPLLRQTLREAFWENHDPCDLAAFASMRHNRPEVLAEQVRILDAAKLGAAEVECVARGITPTERAAHRAQARRLLKANRAAILAAADRATAIANPNPISATIEAPSPPSAPPGAVPSLARLRRLALGE